MYIFDCLYLESTWFAVSFFSIVISFLQTTQVVLAIGMPQADLMKKVQ